MATATRRPGPKKQTIRPPKSYASQFSLGDTWNTLSNNIREIQHHNAHNLSFEENHRFAYNMVLHKQGEMLYRGLKQLVEEHLNELANTLIIPAFPMSSGLEQQTQEGEVLLKALKKVWDDHMDSMVKIGQILKYMDRVYVKAAKVPDTNTLGFQLFLQHIIQPPIQKHLVDAVLDQIQYEREGKSINRSALQGCVDVFLRLAVDNAGTTVYKRDLEPAFLEQSTLFYEEEGKRLVETCDAPEFLARVESRFESEDSRTHHHLSSQTAPAIHQILKNHLLTPHLSEIITMPNSGLDAMIDTDKIDVLSRLYRLYRLVPTGIQILRRALKESIQRRGKIINESSLGNDELDQVEVVDPKGKGKAKAQVNSIMPATSWVQSVLELKDRFDNMWIRAFLSDHDIEIALNEAFESFINLNNKCSEFLSLFIDDNLRRGLKGKTDNEIASVLDKTITIFRYVTEKDVFERYYKTHLAKRLLQSRSVSEDAERDMLGKLKIECGYQFTQKLEGMFNDIKISGETMDGYHKHLAKTTAPDVALSVTVMTSTYWPMSHSGSTCNVPSILTRSCQSFEQYYLSRHSGRRLTWQFGLGNAEVKTRFKAKTHELTVSTFALVILLLFDELGDDEFLTYEEISEATGIAAPELKRHLQSLACAKFKILKKHPAGRDVNETDSFSFNDDFTSSLTKIKVATISSKVETTQERKETLERIDEERRHQIDACIVRIMKDRKHMTHTDLVTETTRQLASRFNPEPLLIKRRIENLIEREYLDRSEDRKSYNYLA